MSNICVVPGVTRTCELYDATISNPDLESAYLAHESALHKSMSAKAPGASEAGKRMDNDGWSQP